jgi:NADH-quinone oxidoreductase subunit J
MEPLPASAGAAAAVGANNTEQIGWALYADYLVPFEVASILLLVAMLGAIVLAKREL